MSFIFSGTSKRTELTQVLHSSSLCCVALHQKSGCRSVNIGTLMAILSAQFVLRVGGYSRQWSSDNYTRRSPLSLWNPQNWAVIWTRLPGLSFGQFCTRTCSGDPAGLTLHVNSKIVLSHWWLLTQKGNSEWCQTAGASDHWRICYFQESFMSGQSSFEFPCCINLLPSSRKLSH